MDTLLLVVTHLFQWDLFWPLFQFLPLVLFQRGGWCLGWFVTSDPSGMFRNPKVDSLTSDMCVHWHSLSAVLLLYASCIDVSFSNRLLSALTEHKNVSFSFQKAELQPDFLCGRNDHLLILFSLSIMFLVC
jgi:hypothetical protein